MAAQHSASQTDGIPPRVPNDRFRNTIGRVTLSVSQRFRSALVDIHDVACCAPAGQRSGEEAATADEIAMVRRGVFLKHAADGEHLLDPTRIGIFRRHQPYVVHHPGEHGDLSTVLVFDRSVLRAAMTDFGPDASSPFAALPSAIPVDRELLLAFHLLQVTLRRSPVDDLLVDEIAMATLDAFRNAAMKVTRSVAVAGPGNEAAMRARTVLATRWSSHLTLHALARQIGVSPFHLCRRFRAATGTTIHRYVTTLRMAAALDRLGDHRNDLARLALDLGYSSHSHFTTAFRAYFGLPPSAAARRISLLRKNLEAPATTMQ